MTIIIDGTNGISGVDGTAGTPAVQGSDANTGLLFPAADTVAISTGGTERLRVDSSGNLGLGVTPSAWTVFKAIQINAQGSVMATSASMQMGNNIYYDGAYKFIGTGYANRYYQATGEHVWTVSTASGTAGGTVTETQAMTLNASGNLGLGATSITGIGSNVTTLQINGRNTTNSGGLRLRSSDASLDCGYYAESGLVHIVAFSNHPLLFETNNTERARITSGGNLLVGTTSYDYRLSVMNTATNARVGYFRADSSSYTDSVLILDTPTSAGTSCRLLEGYSGSSTLCFRIYNNGNVQNTNNSYGSISDLKLKENITDATPKLAALNQLRVVNYNLKGDSLKQIGLIAQEVEQVFPGLVESAPDTVEVTKTRTVEVRAVLDEEGNEITPATTREETYTEREPNGETTKSIKYSVLVPMLLKAVQELTAQNDDLRARVAALEGTQP